jgi:hypothetical protein
MTAPTTRAKPKIALDQRAASRHDDALMLCLAYSRCEASEAMKIIRVGKGAGYSGDRIEPAVELAEKGALDCLVFECLGNGRLCSRSRLGV